MEVVLTIIAFMILMPVFLEVFKELLQALLPLLIVGGITGASALIYSHRRALAGCFEAIARWYYFTFCPHPAEPAVRSALAQGRLLDGHRLAAALGKAPPDNRILREVRIAQGERLVAEMRRVSERIIRDTVKTAHADHARAAAIGIQEAIALAAVALERAKAAHAASKSVR